MTSEEEREEEREEEKEKERERKRERERIQWGIFKTLGRLEDAKKG